MPDDKSPLGGIERRENLPDGNSFELPGKKVEVPDGFGFEQPSSPEDGEKAAEDKPDNKPLTEQFGEDAGIVGASNAMGASIARKKEIEKILESGLEDVYGDLSPEKQAEFARAGEETAGRINELFDTARVTARKIIVLIKKWLLILPGINKFFLEQEVKIKTDEIMKLKN